MINIYMQKAFSSSELLEKAMGRERDIYIYVFCIGIGTELMLFQE